MKLENKLSQSLIAELFGVSVLAVNEYSKNSHDGEELYAEATIRKFRIVRLTGQADKWASA